MLIQGTQQYRYTNTYGCIVLYPKLSRSSVYVCCFVNHFLYLNIGPSAADVDDNGSFCSHLPRITFPCYMWKPKLLSLDTLNVISNTIIVRIYQIVHEIKVYQYSNVGEPINKKSKLNHEHAMVYTHLYAFVPRTFLKCFHLSFKMQCLTLSNCQRE